MCDRVGRATGVTLLLLQLSIEPRVRHDVSMDSRGTHHEGPAESGKGEVTIAAMMKEWPPVQFSLCADSKEEAPIDPRGTKPQLQPSQDRPNSVLVPSQTSRLHGCGRCLDQKRPEKARPQL